MNVTSNKRLLALDVMRGITIAGMILVNNPGSWGHVYAPLKHAPWNGLTPTDLVFPFFMFIMGISTYISLRKYNFTFSTPAALKIIKRTIAIFFIGITITYQGESTSLQQAFYSSALQPVFGNEGGSLAYAILFVLFNWAIGYILYKKKIYIKI